MSCLGDVKLSELDDANAIAENALQNPIFKNLMQNKVHAEKEVTWNHAGIDFKGFVDLESKIDGRTIVCDIKTTTDAGKRFQRDLIYNDYKMQAAMYLENYDDYDMFIFEEIANFYNLEAEFIDTRPSKGEGYFILYKRSKND